MTRADSPLVERLEQRHLLSADPGIDGIGVLGDSYGDEYQFYAPDRATASNWVEQLADDSNVSFGAFSADDPTGPRNAGYAYNWAVSGATSRDVIVGGQAAGVATQAASGAVDVVTLFVGGNDFRDVFKVLATQGPAAAQAALMAVVPSAANNIAATAGTVLAPDVVAANPEVRLVLTTIPKLSHLPEVRRQVAAFPPIQPFVDAVDAAVGVLNGLISDIAGTSNRTAVADFAGLVDRLLDEDARLKVCNVVVERDALTNPTNDPTHFVLADGIHSGTIAQGLLANLMAETVNDAFGTRVRTLSKHDILENAGLKRGAATAPVPRGSMLFSDAPEIGLDTAGWDNDVELVLR